MILTASVEEGTHQVPNEGLAPRLGAGTIAVKLAGSQGIKRERERKRKERRERERMREKREKSCDQLQCTNEVQLSTR